MDNFLCFKPQRRVILGLNIGKASDYFYPAMTGGSRLSSHYDGKLIDFEPQQRANFQFGCRVNSRCFCSVIADGFSSPWPLQRLIFLFTSLFDLSNPLRQRFLVFMPQRRMRSYVENRNFFQLFGPAMS